MRRPSRYLLLRPEAGCGRLGSSRGWNCTPLLHVYTEREVLILEGDLVPLRPTLPVRRGDNYVEGRWAADLSVAALRSVHPRHSPLYSIVRGVFTDGRESESNQVREEQSSNANRKNRSIAQSLLQGVLLILLLAEKSLTGSASIIPHVYSFVQQPLHLL